MKNKIKNKLFSKRPGGDSINKIKYKLIRRFTKKK